MFHIFADNTHLGGDPDPEALKTWAAGTIGDVLIWGIPETIEHGSSLPVWWQTVTPDGTLVEIVKYPDNVVPRN